MPNNGFVVHEFNVDRFTKFLGVLLTLADTLGLPERQVEAYKSLIKQEVWFLWENPWGVEVKESLVIGEEIKE